MFKKTLLAVVTTALFSATAFNASADDQGHGNRQPFLTKALQMLDDADAGWDEQQRQVLQQRTGALLQLGAGMAADEEKE